MKNSIQRKLKARTLYLLFAVVAVLCLTMVAGLYITRRAALSAGDDLGTAATDQASTLIIEQAESELRQLVQSKAELTNAQLLHISEDVERMASIASAMLGSDRFTEYEAMELLRAYILENLVKDFRGERAFYYGTEQGEFFVADSETQVPTNLDMRERPWYIAAAEAGELIWTDIYPDQEGRGLSITCAMPYYAQNGVLAGVAGAGMTVDSITDIVLNSTAPSVGMAIMLGQDGAIIGRERPSNGAPNGAPDGAEPQPTGGGTVPTTTDPNGDPATTEAEPTLADIIESRSDVMLALAECAKKDESCIERITVDDRNLLIAFHGLKAVPWSVAVIVDEAEIMSPARVLENNITGLKDTYISFINERIFIVTLVACTIVAVLILLSMLVSKRTAKRIVAPISKMTEDAVLISQGELNHVLDINTGDELEILANTFNSMIGNVKSITAEREKTAEERNTITNLENILNGINAQVYATVPETGELLFVNKQLKALFGRENDDMTGEYCFKAFRGRDEMCEFCPCHELNENPGKTIMWEEYIESLGRHILHSDSYISWPTTTTTTTTNRIVHIQHAVDITELRKTQEELSDKNLVMNMLIKGMNVGLWDRLIDGQKTYDDGDTHLWWSDEFRNLLGFTDENDFPNKTSSWLNRIHPDDLQHTIDIMNAFLEDKTDNTPYNVYNRMKMKSGEYRWFRSFGSCIRDEDGNPLRTAGATEDVTALKEAEREIAEKNDMNMTMFNNAPVGLTVFDENFKFIDCNENVLKMYGVSREFYRDFFGSAAHSPEYQADGQRSSDKAITLVKQVMDGELVAVDWVHKTPAGELLPVELTMTRVKQGNKFVGLGYIYDMREQTKLKEKIRDALYRAETANRAKSIFLANMSHEIRTPMNAILGTAEIEMQKSSLPSDTEEALDRICESGNLLLNIINDILDFSKIEAGKLEIAPTEYDVPSLINDVVQINRVRYESKPIEFLVEIDAKTPFSLFGDELRIKQVMSNIISNAHKYTSGGTVKLLVGFEEALGGAGDVVLVFRVSDTGQGMTAEQVSKLFDEYTRFNVDINRAVVGTGLGMSITKRLVDLMDGEIFVESEVGKGSLFTVRIPQRRVSERECGDELAERFRNSVFQSTSTAKKSRMRREYMPYGRVLVVDDVESNIYVTKGMLLPYGLDIDTAGNGLEAVEKIKAGNVYDVVFMDHMMPIMDGIEATKVLRGMGYAHSIIALTANALVGQSEMFLRNGFDAFISKPIDSRELDSILNVFIRDKKSPEVIEKAKARRKRGTAAQGAAGAQGATSQGVAGATAKGGAAAQSGAATAGDTPATPQLGVAASELKELFLLDAENFIDILEKLIANADAASWSGADTSDYEITVHGLKSALANVGEKDLSDYARKLEQAVINKDFPAINSETPKFLDELKAVVEKLR